MESGLVKGGNEEYSIGKIAKANHGLFEAALKNQTVRSRWRECLTEKAPAHIGHRRRFVLTSNSLTQKLNLCDLMCCDFQ